MGPGYYFVVEAGIVFGTVKVDGAGYEHDGPVAMLVGKVCGYGANGVWLYVVLQLVALWLFGGYLEGEAEGYVYKGLLQGYVLWLAGRVGFGVLLGVVGPVVHAGRGV